MMAATISDKWVGVNADALFSKATGCPCTTLNDADVAGLAEMTFGADQGQPGTVTEFRFLSFRKGYSRAGK